MKQKDQIEMAVSDALKAARTSIRLKHSLAADAEINEVLPEIEDAIRSAAAKGKSYRVDLAKLIA